MNSMIKKIERYLNRQEESSRGDSQRPGRKAKRPKYGRSVFAILCAAAMTMTTIAADLPAQAAVNRTSSYEGDAADAAYDENAGTAEGEGNASEAAGSTGADTVYGTDSGDASADTFGESTGSGKSVSEDTSASGSNDAGQSGNDAAQDQDSEQTTDEATSEEDTEEAVSYASGTLTYGTDDDAYKVSVTFDESALLPEGTTLSAAEIPADNDQDQYDYDNYLAQAQNKLSEEDEKNGADAETIDAVHFYDILFTDADGNKVEPDPNANLQVSISYKGGLEKTEEQSVQIFHFTDDNDTSTDKIDLLTNPNVSGDDTNVKFDGISFDTNQFSVYGVALISTPAKEEAANSETEINAEEPATAESNAAEKAAPAEATSNEAASTEAATDTSEETDTSDTAATANENSEEAVTSTAPTSEEKTDAETAENASQSTTESTEKSADESTPSEEETGYAAGSQEATVGNATVNVSYTEDSRIPEGAQLVAEKADDEESYQSKAEGLLADYEIEGGSYLDIHFELNGEEYPVKNDTKVTVTFDNQTALGENEEIKVVHFGKNGPELIESTSQDKAGFVGGLKNSLRKIRSMFTGQEATSTVKREVTFTANEFSVYGIVVTTSSSSEEENVDSDTLKTRSSDSETAGEGETDTLKTHSVDEGSTEATTEGAVDEKKDESVAESTTEETPDEKKDESVASSTEEVAEESSTDSTAEESTDSDTKENKSLLDKIVNGAKSLFGIGQPTVKSISGSQVAADGTYPAYFSVAKYEDGKYKKNYTGILYVVVSDGKIAALDYSGDKAKKINPTLRNSGYIGQTASISATQGVDATSSASLNVTGSTKASSSGKSYVMDLQGTIITALSGAEARDGSSSGETATAVADGIYKGTASNSQATGSEADDKVTVNVTVSDGKITSVDLVSDETVGSWDSLVSTVESEVVGTTAAASNVDAVSSATTKGWKDAVQTAIKNALNSTATSTGGDSGDDNTSDAGKTVYGSYNETSVTIYEGETVTLGYDSDGANDYYTYSWSTSNVSPSGCVSLSSANAFSTTLTGKSAGTATVTCKGGMSFASSDHVFNVTVKAKSSSEATDTHNGQIGVKVAWANSSDAADSVQVKLSALNENDSTVTLNSSNSWSATATGLNTKKTYGYSIAKITKGGEDVTSQYDYEGETSDDRSSVTITLTKKSGKLSEVTSGDNKVEVANGAELLPSDTTLVVKEDSSTSSLESAIKNSSNKTGLNVFQLFDIHLQSNGSNYEPVDDNNDPLPVKVTIKLDSSKFSDGDTVYVGHYEDDSNTLKSLSTSASGFTKAIKTFTVADGCITVYVNSFSKLMVAKVGAAAGTYTGTITSPGSLTDGDYIIVNYARSYAMNGTSSGNGNSGYFLGGTSGTFNTSTATVTDAAAVWTYDSSAGTFKNKSTGSYLYPNGTYNSLLSNSSQKLNVYTISGNEGTVYTGSGTSLNYLGYSSSGGFKSNGTRYMNSSWVSSGSGVYFYKVDGSSSGDDDNPTGNTITYKTGETYSNVTGTYEDYTVNAESGTDVTFTDITFTDSTFNFDKDALIIVNGSTSSGNYTGLKERFTTYYSTTTRTWNQINTTTTEAYGVTLAGNAYSGKAGQAFSQTLDVSQMIETSNLPISVSNVSVTSSTKAGNWLTASASGTTVTLSGTPTSSDTGLYPLVVITFSAGGHNFAIPLAVQVTADSATSELPDAYGDKVSRITVTKAWDSAITDDEKADTVVASVTSGSDSQDVTLTSDGNWTGTVTVDSDKTYTVTEKSATKDGTDVKANFTATVTKGTATTSTATGTVATKQTSGTITSGSTYAFLYQDDGKTYALGVDDSNNIVGLEVNGEIPAKAKWVVTQSTSRYRSTYGNYTLYNTQTGGTSAYLNAYTSSPRLSSSSLYYGAFDLNSDGSILGKYNGYYVTFNGSSISYSTSNTDNSKFTTYLIGSGTVTTTTTPYTITNTKATEPAHHKTISEKQSDDTYNLSLSMKGVSKTETTQTGGGITTTTTYEPVDVILLVDFSYSIRNSQTNVVKSAKDFIDTLAGYSTDTKVAVVAYGQTGGYGTPSVSASAAYDTGNETAPSGTEYSQMNLYRNIYTINNGWTTLSSSGASTLESGLDSQGMMPGGDYDPGTNHAGAYAKAQRLLSDSSVSSDGRSKYVINISDGIFDYSSSPYYDSSYSTSMKSNGVVIYYLYWAGSGTANSTYMSTLASGSSYVLPAGTNATNIASQISVVESKIKEDTKNTTTTPVTKVMSALTIQDTLSDYVDFAGSSPQYGVTVTKSKDGESDTELTYGTDYTVSVSGKVITVNFVSGYSFDADATYTATFPVKANDAAQTYANSQSASTTNVPTNADSGVNVTYKVEGDTDNTVLNYSEKPTIPITKESTPVTPTNYTINGSVTHGTMTIGSGSAFSSTTDTAATGSQTVTGGNVTVTYSAQDGYVLKSVTVDGTEQDISDNATSYTFNSVGDKHNIVVVYEAQSTPSTSTSGVDKITVTKEWKDSSGNTISAPSDTTVTVNVKNGDTTVDTLTLNADGNWTATTDATLDSDTNYTIEEEAISGYTASYSGPVSGTSAEQTTYNSIASGQTLIFAYTSGSNTYVLNHSGTSVSMTAVDDINDTPDTAKWTATSNQYGTSTYWTLSNGGYYLSIPTSTSSSITATTTAPTSTSSNTALSFNSSSGNVVIRRYSGSRSGRSTYYYFLSVSSGAPAVARSTSSTSTTTGTALTPYEVVNTATYTVTNTAKGGDTPDNPNNPSTDKSAPTHAKALDSETISNDGTWTLGLNAVGTTTTGSSSSGDTSNYDVLFIVDVSGSMTSGRLSTLKNAVTNSGLINTILSTSGNRVGIIQFAAGFNNSGAADGIAGLISSDTPSYDDAQTVLNWTTSASTASAAFSGLSAYPNYSTNVGAGLYYANSSGMLTNGSNKKIIILLSDGEPNTYYDSDGHSPAGDTSTCRNYAYTQASAISSKVSAFYAISTAASGSSDNPLSFLNTLAGYFSTNAVYDGNDNLSSLTQAFTGIGSSISSPTNTYTGVSIKDTLSDDFEFNSTTTTDTSNFWVVRQKTDGSGSEENVDATIALSDNNKTVTATIGMLEGGYTYTLKFKIKAKQATYDTAAANMNDSDDSTDNKFATNSSASITYTPNGGTEATTSYTETPEATVPVSTLTINKTWSGDSSDTSTRPSSVTFTVYQDSGDTAYTTTDLTSSGNWTDSITVPAGSDGHSYRVVESDVDGYTARASEATASLTGATAQTGSVSFTNVKDNSGTTAQSFLEVKKTFTGITSSEIPTDFQIDVEQGSAHYKLTGTDTTDGTLEKSTDGLTWTWRINNAAAGTYSVSESNNDVSGYTLTTNGTGNSVTTLASANIDFSGVKLITTNSDTKFSFDGNQIFLADITGNNAQTIVISNVRLNNAQRAAVQNLLNQKNNNLGNNNFNTTNVNYYVASDLGGDGITLKGYSVKYNSSTKEIEFESTSIWNKAAYGTMTGTGLSSADIEVTNTYSSVPLTGMTYGKDGRAILLTLIALAAVAGGAVYFRRRRKKNA